MFERIQNVSFHEWEIFKTFMRSYFVIQLSILQGLDEGSRKNHYHEFFKRFGIEETENI